jgi:hypothetical protein
MANFYKVIRVSVGVFLLTAACLKAHGLFTDPLAQDSLLFTPRLLIATIEIEILLGLWMLSGWAARASRLAALTFFGTLAAASLYLALDGQPSCGCLGRVTLSPWWSFGLDVAILATLLFSRPSSSLATLPAGARNLIATGIGAAGFLMLIGGAFLLASEDPVVALARLRGEPIAVEPSVSELGAGIAGEQRTITVQLTNRTGQAVRIVGGTSNCDCIATGDLPVAVPPGESQPITVKLSFKGKVGRFQRSFALYTDDTTQPLVVARFAGRVVPQDSQ